MTGLVYDTAALLRDHGDRRFLLVTSAFHMRRAAAAFHAQGMVADRLSGGFPVQCPDRAGPGSEEQT